MHAPDAGSAPSRGSRHTLLVVANPEGGSLTHHLAGQLEEALSCWGPVEVADLARESFDPRFTVDDRLVYQGLGALPVDVQAEHERLERATDLALVFPVYWWSMPSLLKGWVDRVFVNGWAFDYDPEQGLQPKLQHLTTHLLPVAASDAGLYERHGYGQALRTQLEHGLVDYCGSLRGTTAFVYDSEDVSEEVRTRRVHEAVRAVTDFYRDRAAAAAGDAVWAAH
jgi:NAD(P)H dehydrogenase (quinone)